jgi:hypothetical protein
MGGFIIAIMGHIIMGFGFIIAINIGEVGNIAIIEQL